MTWITKNGTRIKVKGEYIVKANGKVVNSFADYELAKAEADKRWGQVWHNDLLMYSANRKFANNDSEPTIIRSYLLTPEKPKRKK